MTIRRKPKRLPGDNPLLRAAYEHRVARHKDYATWLYDQGIDPDTGKMNACGLEFYRLLLDRQDRENRASRRQHAA